MVATAIGGEGLNALGRRSDESNETSGLMVPPTRLALSLVEGCHHFSVWYSNKYAAVITGN
jgi:hypothetical protein